MSPQQWSLPHKNLMISQISTVPSLHFENQSKRQKLNKLLRRTEQNYGKPKKNNPLSLYHEVWCNQRKVPKLFLQMNNTKKNLNNGKKHNLSWFYHFHSACYWKASGLSALAMAQQFLKATFKPRGLSHM